MLQSNLKAGKYMLYEMLVICLIHCGQKIATLRPCSASCNASRFIVPKITKKVKKKTCGPFVSFSKFFVVK